MNEPLTDAVNALNFLHDPGAVFELCVIRPKKITSNFWTGRANGKKVTISGWYRNPEAAAKLAVEISEKIKAEGIYTTLNPCKEALLARADHRLEPFVDRTADVHIARIKNLLIDIDPDPGGPAGISSTDVEHEAALEMAQVIRADLSKGGWPEPMPGDSGNGAHLIYPVDLPNTEESKALIKSVLEALDLRYQDDLAQLNLGIDQNVFNPARLTKLYGTWVRKGDNTKTRPHRLARILSLPEVRRPVPVEMLRKLAGTLPQQDTKQSKVNERSVDGGCLDVAAYLNHYGVQMIKEKPHQNGTLFCLQTCLFNPDHAGNEAAIGQAADGKLFYQCFHNSCQGRTWAEARAIISGDDKLMPFMVGGGGLASINNSSSFLNIPIEGVKSKVEKALRNGGLTEPEIAYVLNLINKPEPGKSIAQEVRDWARLQNGFFMTSQCFNELGLTSRDFKKAATLELLRLKNKGILESCSEKRGCYRLVDTTAEELRWWEADTANIVPLELPFDLHKQITIFHKTVIIVAGVTDSGKTAYLLNTALRNRNKLKVNYFSLEMPEQELKKRLERFKEVGIVEDMNEWREVAFKERSHNFHQVIKPDEINIIDYLEVTKEFWQIADQISEIYNKLNKGVAIIALQKKQGQEYGLGGHFSAFRARLYIAMDKNELRVVKAKNWNDLVTQNPANKVYGYKLVKGAKFIPWEK